MRPGLRRRMLVCRWHVVLVQIVWGVIWKKPAAVFFGAPLLVVVAVHSLAHPYVGEGG